MIGKHPRDIWEASGRHLGSKGAPRRHPGGTQETPRRHPGGTQEAASRHPGAPRAPGSLQEVLGAKRSIHISVNAKNEEKTKTSSRGVFEGRCHQVPRLATKSIRHPPRTGGRTTKGSLSKPPEPLQMKSVWGIMWMSIQCSA